MKEIIISIYDSAWNWTILRIDNDKIYKTDKSVENLGAIEQAIYDSQLLTWQKYELTTEVILKKLQEKGYNKVTVCENGDIEIYESCVRKI